MQTRSDGLVPAVADATVIRWSLGKEVGDVIEYTDESGTTFEILLAAGLENSIFQGNIIIAEEMFRDRYPSIDGYRFFLIKAPTGGNVVLREMIDSQLVDFGADISGTQRRLAEYYSVQNSYVAIFMTLGWIGVLLGTLGLGIAVYRNVHDSREEWALMSAFGYNERTIRRTAYIEQVIPAVVGIVVGTISAIIAVWPSGASPGISWITLAGLTALLVAFAAVFIVLAVRLALPRRTAEALRSE
jgi:ABC-type antimicrobial peptide transport system permease subunit